jgi:hypothetical protein
MPTRNIPMARELRLGFTEFKLSLDSGNDPNPAPRTRFPWRQKQFTHDDSRPAGLRACEPGARVQRGPAITLQESPRRRYPRDALPASNGEALVKPRCLPRTSEIHRLRVLHMCDDHEVSFEPGRSPIEA